MTDAESYVLSGHALETQDAKAEAFVLLHGNLGNISEICLKDGRGKSKWREEYLWAGRQC